MIQEIEEILSKPVKEVINSPLSLTLLKIYSTLYLGGGQPRWCERSQTSYYNQLAIDGLKKAKQMENSGVLEARVFNIPVCENQQKNVENEGPPP